MTEVLFLNMLLLNDTVITFSLKSDVKKLSSNVCDDGNSLRSLGMNVMKGALCNVNQLMVVFKPKCSRLSMLGNDCS